MLAVAQLRVFILLFGVPANRQLNAMCCFDFMKAGQTSLTLRVRLALGTLGTFFRKLASSPLAFVEAIGGPEQQLNLQRF